MCSLSATNGLEPLSSLLVEENATSIKGTAKIKIGRYIDIPVDGFTIPVIDSVASKKPAYSAPESPIKILAGL